MSMSKLLLIGAGTVTVLALTHAKLIKLWRRSNSKVKLTYFDLKGKGNARGAPSRAAPCPRVQV